MNRLATSLFAALALAGGAGAAAAQTSPMPPQGGPGVYREAGALAATLQAAAKAAPALGLSPILVTDRYSIQEVHRGAAGPPAIHPGWSELHYILDGGGVLLTGGRIVPGVNGAPATIEGGTPQKVRKGDAVVVPPDTAHQYLSVDGAVTYLEVRFPDPALAKP